MYTVIIPQGMSVYRMTGLISNPETHNLPTNTVTAQPEGLNLLLSYMD
jgi:hypothetical protein